MKNALPNGTYYWRVRTNAPTESLYSLMFKVTVNAAFMPDTPVLLLPTELVIVATTRPIFTWQPAPYANVYQLQLDDDPNFTSPHFTTTTSLPIASTTQLDTFSDFNQGPQYWRVRSIYTTGSSATAGYSLWSQPKLFTINPALSPANNSAVTVVGAAQMATVGFTWSAAPNSVSILTPPMYTVQVNDDTAFIGEPDYSCISNVAITKTCSIQNIPLGVYYWRVVRSGEVPIGAPVYNRFVVSPAPVRAPVATSPTNGKILQPTERPAVNLAWSWGALAAPVGTFTYDVEISTSKLFNIEVSDSATGLSAQAYQTAPLAKGIYYWRVRSVNVQGVPGLWSLPFSFVVDDEAPAAPLIKTPLLNTIVPTARPTITWAVSPGASHYVVEVHEVSCTGTLHYKSLLLKGGLTAIMSHLIPQTLPQGQLVVCVKAYDLSGNEGDFGEARAFTIFLGLKPAVNLFIPTTIKPTFTWTAVPGTTNYTLQVDNDTNWGNGDVYNVLLGAVTTHAIPLGTLGEGTYYWRVVRNDETFTSYTSRVFYVGALKAGPVLNPQTVIKLPVTLSWNPATAPNGTAIDEYQVELSKVATFVPVLSSTKINALDPQEMLFTPLANQNAIRHYWRVRGLVNGAPVTNWSTSSFIVDNLPPVQPVITSPLPNALVNTVRPAITWTAVPGAARYTVAIKDSVTDEDVVDEQPVVGLKLVLPENLPQSELVLRVRAEDTINIGEWRYVSFKVRLGTLPAQNAVVIVNRPIFTWLAVPGATAYTLQIDDDPLFDNTADTYPTKTIVLGNVLTYTLPVAEPLPANGLYYWRVLPQTTPASDYPASLGSRIFYFTAPTATKPIGLATFANGVTSAAVFNKSTYEAGGVTFSWNSVTPAPILYEVQVSTTALFPAVGTTLHTSATTSLLLTGNQLQDGVKYWRVRSIYSADRTSYGVWSAVNSFKLDQLVPLPPMIPATVSSLAATNRPTFTWAASLGADRYYLTVEGTAIDHILVTGTSYKVPPTMAPLNQNTETGYTWSVEAEDLAGNRSSPSLERTLYVFVGLTPKQSMFLTSLKPVFTWTPLAGTGAAPWILEIATNQTMTNKVYTSPQLPSTLATFTPPNAIGYGLFYWRVYRVGEPLANISGQSFYITTNIVNAGAKPEYPLNGSAVGRDELEAGLYVQWKTVVPDWSALAFSQGYLLEISPSPTFIPLTDFAVVLGDSSIPSNAIIWDDLPVLDGKLYYWRVRGFYGRTNLGPDPQIEDFLDLDLGPIGGVFTFKVDLTPPASPALGLPVTNAVLVTRTPTFTWAAAAGVPARYRVEISTDANFTSIIQTASVAAPKLALTLPTHQSLPNGSYYWRIVAQDIAYNDSIPGIGMGRRFIIAVP